MQRLQEEGKVPTFSLLVCETFSLPFAINRKPHLTTTSTTLAQEHNRTLMDATMNIDSILFEFNKLSPDLQKLVASFWTAQELGRVAQGMHHTLSSNQDHTYRVYCALQTLTRSPLVCKSCKQLCEDKRLWDELFFRESTHQSSQKPVTE
jgi:hypothetical protein